MKCLVRPVWPFLSAVFLTGLFGCSTETVHTLYLEGEAGIREGGLPDDAERPIDAAVIDSKVSYYPYRESDSDSDRDDSGNGTAGGQSHLRRDASCAGATESVELTPLDMVIALDTSYSMDFLGKWPAVKQAINIFTADPNFAGLGVGIQYFPIRKQCSAPDYADLAVDVEVLPDNASPISESLNDQRMSGGTPMAPMLEGVLDYARQRVEDNPDRNVVVVIATDGIPDSSCISDVSGSTANTLKNVVLLAEQGASGENPISTFVVGVGTELTALNEIARAGSGADAFFVDTSADIQQVFLEALTEIRRRALACEHQLPDKVSGVQVINYNKVNVVFTTDQEEETFFRVSDQQKCDDVDDYAWYYDDPKDPDKIVLCPDTCDHVQTFAEGVFDVQVGCDTIVY